jgi:hypothetical protein
VRPALEVADIFRRHGVAYRAEQADHMSAAQRRVMAAIEACRTATLGGHVESCDGCGETRVAYNSANAAARGLCVDELDTIDPKASQELTRLVVMVFDHENDMEERAA